MKHLFVSILLLGAIPACEILEKPENLFGKKKLEGSYHLRIDDSNPFLDATASSPILANKTYQSVMIVSPSGTVRGEFDELLAVCERAFMSRGIRVISPAITGRIVAKGNTEIDGKIAGANLSDVERALVLAKESNAQAVLQIGFIGWQDPGKGSAYEGHFFLANSKKPEDRWLVETSREVYTSTRAPGVRLAGDKGLQFTGRLIEVENGEVMASFNIIGLAAKILAVPYEATFDLYEGEERLYLKKANFDWDSPEWRKDARDRLPEKLFSRIASIISKGDP